MQNKRSLWSGGILIGLLLIAAVAWPMLGTSLFALSLCSLILLNMIGAVSLHLVIRTGHISLGHAAFMGVGSYACVISVVRGGLDPVLGLAVGVIAAAAVAALIGPIVLRLTGKYFVLVTFLLGEIVRQVFVEWVSVTGGANGISSVPPLHASLATPLAMYYCILLVSLACVGLCWLLLRSEIGRAIDSVREAPNVAEASGISVLRLKVGVFVLACAMAGLQGGLLAFFLNYIDPHTFGMTASLNFVVMNIIGGMYNLIGPLLGAVFLVALPELLRGYVEIQQILFGIILIVVMASFTGGIVEVSARVRGLLRSVRKGAA
jgi:branched-chain amino acid transport system permease protein